MATITTISDDEMMLDEEDMLEYEYETPTEDLVEGRRLNDTAEESLAQNASIDDSRVSDRQLPADDDGDEEPGEGRVRLSNEDLVAKQGRLGQKNGLRQAACGLLGHVPGEDGQS